MPPSAVGVGFGVGQDLGALVPSCHVAEHVDEGCCKPMVVVVPLGCWSISRGFLLLVLRLREFTDGLVRPAISLGCLSPSRLHSILKSI